MTNDVVPFQQMERMAQAIAKSGLFGIANADQALALMSIAVAEGKHPAIVARDYHIIQNKASKKAEAMLRDMIAAGGSVEWHELTDSVADATFRHPQGGEVRIKWDTARAKQAGLADRDNWKKYPRAMLRSRTVSEGCRTVAPLSTSGFYTPEEVQDIAAEEKDVTPQSPTVEAAAQANATALTPDERAEHFATMAEATSTEQLRAAFAAAWKHAGEAKDTDASQAFKRAYDSAKGPITDVTDAVPA